MISMKDKGGGGVSYGHGRVLTGLKRLLKA